jgi:outer membrane lipoprotein-sorting protein
MKKLILIAALFLVAAGALRAQSDFGAVASVADFKQRLKAASATLLSIESDFSQSKYIDLLAEEIISTGRFYYKKVNKICLDYATPVSYLVVINEGIIKITSDGKTSVYEVGKNKMMAQMNTLMMACMNGNLDALISDFRLQFLENEAQYLISVQPKAGNRSPIRQMDILLDKKDFSVQELKMTEASKDYTVYTFSEKKKNIVLPDSKFAVQ